MDQRREKELFDLLDAWCEGLLTPDSAARLDATLQGDTEARWQYLCYMQLHGALQLDPAALTTGLPAETSSKTIEVQVPGASLGHAVVGEAPPQRSVASIHIRDTRDSGPRTFHLSAIAALAAFVAVGVLVYTFWPGPAQPPGVEQIPASIPAAKIVSTTEATWAGANAPGDDTLTVGQRLFLQSGSAQITFDSQARVMLEGPAELTIIDAAACRLSTGKLTAHVPDLAKGFQVHTPSGTVTDLGTEFGVYVKTGPEISESNAPEEQQESGIQHDGKHPPVTEVHVFKGMVDVVPGDDLAQAPSDTNPKSKILSAGEAIVISNNKVQPLPAADPFKFALDKLSGRPRTVLLAEDFEKYDVGVKRESMGDWMVQGSIRKGQAIGIGDYDKWLADEIALHGVPDPSLNPPPSISRMLMFAPSAPNPTGDFPKVARAIEAPQLAHTCQVLVEFLILPTQAGIEPSFALAAEAGVAPGIEVWRNADPAAPPIPWKTNLVVYRVRVLMNVVEGTLRDARVERSQWSGSAGWVRDAEFQTPVPKVDWTTPPKYAVFGFPVVSAQTAANRYSIDNIRMEVISEK